MITSSRRPWVPLVVSTLALALRVAGAWLRPTWHDEYFTAWAARLPWSELLAALRLDSGPPLVYVLAHVGASLGIPPLAAARGFSVLAGMAAVVLVGLTAQRLWGHQSGWLAALLLACHPLAVHWASEGRAYSLVLAAAAWAWYSLVRLKQDGSGAGGLGAAVALGCWSHSLGLVLAATLAALCLLLPGAARRRAWLAVALGLGSHLPWLPVMLGQPPAAIGWMAGLWENLPIPRSSLLAILRYLSPTAPFGAVIDLPSAPLLVELAGGMLVLLLLVLAIHRGRTAALPALGVALPALAFWVLLRFETPIFYPGRSQVLMLVPFLLLLVTADGILPRAAGLGLATAGLGLSILALTGWAFGPTSTESLLAGAVRTSLAGGGTVVIGGAWRLGLDYHLDDGRSSIELVTFPAAAGRHPGWYVAGHEPATPGELESLAARLAGRPQRTAVLISPGLDTSEPLRRLATRLGLRPTLALPGAELYLSPPASGLPPPGAP